MGSARTSDKEEYSPLAARTQSHHIPVDPVAFNCVKIIVVRAGSARLFSEFGRQHINVGDVVVLAANTLCGAEPEGWTPILFLSGRVSDTDLAAGIECGGDDYLFKPVSPVVLGAKLFGLY